MENLRIVPKTINQNESQNSVKLRIDLEDIMVKLLSDPAQNIDDYKNRIEEILNRLASIKEIDSLEKNQIDSLVTILSEKYPDINSSYSFTPISGEIIDRVKNRINKRVNDNNKLRLVDRFA